MSSRTGPHITPSKYIYIYIDIVENWIERA